GLVDPPAPPVGRPVLATFLVANLSWVFTLLYFWGAYYERLTAGAEAELQVANAETERLLHNILPVAIAERLKQREVIADRYEVASVLFADIVGFTVLSGKLEAAALVRILDDLFQGIDDLVDQYRLEKIKTIGDA